jgi:hypothetical protein
MFVRIRFRSGPRTVRRRGGNRRVASAITAFLTPAAAMAFALGCWGIAADLNWTSSFVIDSGVFSHWQVWLATAAGLQLCSRTLNRYGKSEDAATS